MVMCVFMFHNHGELWMGPTWLDCAEGIFVYLSDGEWVRPYWWKDKT
jgi:hypothetical protein